MDQLTKRYKTLCNDLNLDKATADDAWKTFKKCETEFILEGDKLHWLACAIYIGCRKSVTNNNNIPTRSHQQQSLNIETNCLSLTRLLRSCKLNLVEFFSKMKKWLDMTNMHSFRCKLEHLERNFNVSAVIFKKYQPIFMDVFQEFQQVSTIASSDVVVAAENDEANQLSDQEVKTKDDDDQSKSSKIKPKARKSPAAPSCAPSKKQISVTPAEIFAFCWTLYVNVKANYSTISDDLVNSYHLLLACVDFCHANASECENGSELLNSKFPQLSSETNQNASSTTCILKTLCNRWDGMVVEAKGIREHWLRPFIRKLIDKKVLRCQDQQNCTGFFEISNFEHNIKQITREHDHCVLNIGDFDERIFLRENATEELGTPAYNLEDLDRMMSQRHVPTSTSIIPQTPLSNRQYLNNREIGSMTPVSNATQSVNRLHALLVNRKDVPSQTLENIFELCESSSSSNLKESILKRVDEMGQTFVAAYTSNDSDQQAVDLAKKRLDLGRKLYFKVLEEIMLREQKRLPTDKIEDSLNNLLSHEIFHVSLFACCMEIVLVSYNAVRTFPWILDVFKDFRGSKLYPFAFYKVIEPLIREEEGLPRDVVKHLSSIEEKILESMAWESYSPLWTAIATNGRIPACQDVVLPPSNTDYNPPGMSPLSFLKRREGFQSPISTSDRYSHSIESGARRRLFTSSTPVANDQTSNAVSNSQQGQRIQLAFPTKTSSGIKYVRLQAITMPVNQAGNNATNATQARETETSALPIRPAVKLNPVNIFFRKVYYLAQLRFRDLWDKLNISDQDLQRKIWTLFENQLRNHTNLMKNRHLDQMIMCAIYAVIKVCKTEQSSNFFREIMKAYRLQPQASNPVYRNVLLATKTVPQQTIGKSPKSYESPVQSAAEAPRGDLIQFYNDVYVPQVKQFVRDYATQPDSSLTLSPLPRMNTNPMSPWRRVSPQHSVYVSPLNSSLIPKSPGRPLSYSFQRSPAKDLRTINNMINRDKQRTISKRMFQDELFENNSSKRWCGFEAGTKKLNDIY